MCRPSANTENSHRTREKPLVPRVNLVCYTWPVVCGFTQRSLGMSLSSSYQFPHGSVIKFFQFPCSAVFVVGEMTCTLGGKDQTALYSLGVSICKNSHWEWDFNQNKAGHRNLVPPPHPALLILSIVFYNQLSLRTKDIFLNLAQLFLVFKGWSVWALRTAKNASWFNKDN